MSRNSGSSRSWNTGSKNAGRKKQSDKTLEPLSLAGAPPRGAQRVRWFAEKYAILPSGKGAKGPFLIRDWQQEILDQAFPDSGERPKQVLIELARGQGKSTLAILLAMYAAYADDVESPQVLLVASNERQAENLLKKAWVMISRSPELAKRSEFYKSANRIEIGYNDGAIMAMPSRFDALQGWEPSFAILDEAHVVDQEVYDALVTSLGKQETACLLTISTPGDSQETLLWRLVQHGKEGLDPRFRYITHAAPDGCDWTDREMWKLANPALGDFLHIDGLESAFATMQHRENQFRRLHLCQWAGNEDAWIPWGVWANLADEEHIVEPGTAITLGFDGAWTRDATALVACTIPERDESPHLFVLGLWEYDGPGWRTPLDEVNAKVDYAFETFNVREMACDKNHWRNEVEHWRAKHGEDRVVDFSQGAATMIPATDTLYQSIMEGRVSHDGHGGLHRHIHNAVAVEKNGGVQIYKPKNAPDKDSPVGRIDAAVAAIMAHARAHYYAGLADGPSPFVILV